VPRQLLHARALSFPARACGLNPTLLTNRPSRRVSLQTVTDPAETFQALLLVIAGTAKRPV
jgi:hypothetical protein